jgi:DNA-binding GntR family transcriptional regulator
MILAGELAPGARLRQVEIAERFGVSTTPVREAFTWLVRHGLVQYDSHRGFVVFAPSVDDVTENWELRQLLEPHAAEHAARRITTEQLAELDAIVAEMREALDSDDTTRFLTELNPRFHAIIYMASGRPRLAEIIESLRDAAIAYQRLIGSVQANLSPEFKASEHEQHARIVEALHAHAPKRAAKAVHSHLAYNLEAVLRALPEGDTQHR